MSKVFDGDNRKDIDVDAYFSGFDLFADMDDYFGDPREAWNLTRMMCRQKRINDRRLRRSGINVRPCSNRAAILEHITPIPALAVFFPFLVLGSLILGGAFFSTLIDRMKD